MWNTYINAASIEDVIQSLAKDSETTKIIAGATDLMLEFKRGQQKTVENVIDISRIPGLDLIELDQENIIHIGPNVTHNDCVSSKLLREFAIPLVLASWSVGSPQIRNRGTIVGNIVTASPANDTIPALMALNAKLTLRSPGGKRIVALKDFYLGVRKTVLNRDELVVDISFPALESTQRGTFLKIALREAQAISVVNTGIVLRMSKGIVDEASITLGSVAPTIIFCPKACSFLVGKSLDIKTINEAAKIALDEAHPISDIRGSADYRSEMVRVVVKRGLSQIQDGSEAGKLPSNPICLVSTDPDKSSTPFETTKLSNNDLEMIVLNRTEVSIQAKPTSLLSVLRDDAGLIGSKEGCGEGECGACTMFLDGKAVMGCLVPAPRAAGANIVTIEGITPDKGLNPIQQAFIDEGAVQCGYCTPGFIMSAAKLLEEKSNPSQDEIRQAISGNLCRCTGYYKIIKAIEKAAESTGG